MLGDGAFNFRLFLRVSLLAAAFLLLTEVHGLSLNDLTFRCANHWGVHAKWVSVNVKEDGGRWLHDAWH